MRLNEYQELSKRTLPKRSSLREKLLNYSLGVVGEAAEISEHVKKASFHGHKLDPEKIKGELGDVLHYVAGLATFLGFTLEDVAAHNIEKLKKTLSEWLF